MDQGILPVLLVPFDVRREHRANFSVSLNCSAEYMCVPHEPAWFCSLHDFIALRTLGVKLELGKSVDPFGGPQRVGRELRLADVEESIFTDNRP